ncbi:MAG: transcriptional repressor LexA [Bacilli bacterium]|nr:MAG: transcriptional repressor LexA [Bacilli bacterium]
MKKRIPKERKKTSNHLLELQVPNEYEYKNDDVVTVPLLGKVTAGNPIEAIEVPNEVISLPSYLLPKRKEVFTIKVSGDSMINAGIYDNDIVIVERCKTAKNGDIIVAMDEENQVTIKRYFKESDYIRLQPENDYMIPIIVKDITILGKAIGLYRKF